MQESKKFAFDVSMTFIASGIAMFLSYIITILLGRYVGAESLGLFRMCSSIYSIAIVVAAVGIPSAMVKYAAESKGNRVTFSQIVSASITTSLGLGIISIAVFYFLSGTFAELFRMPALAQLLKVLSLAFPFALVASVLIGMLNGIREMGKYNRAIILQSILLIVITMPLILVIISAITNIVLNIILIPSIGIMGAALATTVSLSVFTLSGLYFTARILNVKIDFTWFAKMCGVTLLFIAASTASGFINHYLLYMSILLSYILVILFFFFTKRDRAYFMGVARDIPLFLKQLL